MKTPYERLMGQRAVLVDRANAALNQKKYQRWERLWTEIQELTKKLSMLDPQSGKATLEEIANSRVVDLNKRKPQ